jgi:dienelactone hydrolase
MAVDNSTGFSVGTSKPTRFFGSFFNIEMLFTSLVYIYNIDNFLIFNTMVYHITRFAVIASCLFFCLSLGAQQIGSTTVTFIDSSRNNRPISTDIYYPATTAGVNAQIAPGVFPVLVLGHGFVMTTAAYQNYRDALVPEGYILALPNTEGSFGPSHADFGLDLRFIVSRLQSHGTGTAIQPVHVATTSAIMGHSMGGGSAFLASQNNVGITTLVTFAAANTNPSSVAAATQISVPTLQFSGVNDCVTPPVQHQDQMYDSTAAAYKTQIYVTGGGHCFFANSNFNCTLGEATCSPNPTITRDQQQDVTHDFVKLWLAYYLKDDCSRGLAFQDSLTQSARITYRQNQGISCINQSDEQLPTADEILVYPNPFFTDFTIDIPNHKLHTIDVYDALKRRVAACSAIELNGSSTIDCSMLLSGTYFVKINNRYWKRIVKQ